MTQRWIFFFEKHGPYNFAQRQGNEKKNFRNWMRILVTPTSFWLSTLLLVFIMCTCIYCVMYCLYCFVV